MTFLKNIQITLPDGFIDAEYRSGHYISSDMKKVWAVELDLLYVFQIFCTKHNLKWFLAYGSLIGAVRHQGFIPWDNDIDVMMPREDFDKFCSLAPNYFNYPYFFQTPLTENGRYYRPYAKLCNSETTGCSELEFLQGINGGIFIDIFVLDSIPDNNILLWYYQKKINQVSHYSRFLSPYTTAYSGIKRFKNYYWTLTWKLKGSFKGDYLFEKVQEYCIKINKAKGTHCTFLAAGIKPKEIWEKEWWGKQKMVPFEFITVPIPCGYDMILSKQYGDYMIPPNIENRITHDYLVFSANIPYSDYYLNVYHTSYS